MSRLIMEQALLTSNFLLYYLYNLRALHAIITPRCNHYDPPDLVVILVKEHLIHSSKTISLARLRKKGPAIFQLMVYFMISHFRKQDCLLTIKDSCLKRY